MKPLLMVWNLQAAAVKPFANCFHEILMVWNFHEDVVKPFEQFYNDFFYILIMF